MKAVKSSRPLIFFSLEELLQFIFFKHQFYLQYLFYRPSGGNPPDGLPEVYTVSCKESFFSYWIYAIIAGLGKK